MPSPAQQLASLGGGRAQPTPLPQEQSWKPQRILQQPRESVTRGQRKPLPLAREPAVSQRETLSEDYMLGSTLALRHPHVA